MITAFDPTGYLNQLGFKFNKSSTPVPIFNFLGRDGKHIEQCEKYFLFDEECLNQEEYEWMNGKKPIAVFSDMIALGSSWGNDFDRVFYPMHFIKTLEVNQRLGRLEKFNIRDDRPFLAEALLGSPKFYRWQILVRIREMGLLDNCLLNFQPNSWCKMDSMEELSRKFIQWGPPESYRSPELDKIDDPHVTNRIKNFNEFDSTNVLPNLQEWTCRIIQRKIYESSWYSIVPLTHTNNLLFFGTEKMAKPLLSERVFLVAGTMHALRTLRSLGFETFEDVIDESYDDIENEIERIDHMMMSFKKLSKENPKLIYSKVESKLKHNKELMNKTFLSTQAREYLRGFFAAHN